VDQRPGHRRRRRHPAALTTRHSVPDSVILAIDRLRSPVPDLHRLDVFYEFDVGKVERHHVVFHWDQAWGVVTLSVDDVPRLRKRHFFGGLVHRYEITVGVDEVHEVAIEKHRPMVLAGARTHTFVLYVDHALVAEF
jgi:hypothetical protein